MAKIIIWFCVYITLLINVIDSITVVNNVTVSSDFLSEVFIQETMNNRNNLLNISIIPSNRLNSNKCILDVRELIKRLPSLEVLPFFDSWGKLPPGIMYGNFYSMGNFDQCTKSSIVLRQSANNVNGQFCFVNIPLISKQTTDARIPFEIEGQHSAAKANLKKTDLELHIGICVPESCSPQYLTTIFQKAVRKITNNGNLANITVSQCSNGKRPDLRVIDIVGITIFSIVGTLMILSSLYDFFTAYYQKPAIPVMLAFSIQANGKKLFAINTTSSSNTISCLTGVRVISMIWIVYCHTYMTILRVPVLNKSVQATWLKAFWSMPVLNGTVSVDSFFFISGLLVAWLGFRELDKTKGKLNIVMMYVHRYIRLTPVVAAVLLYGLSINKLIYTGPFREVMLARNECNGYNWWPVLLYIPNYFLQEPRCFDTSWYLDVDFQLYVLSPLLLIPMWKWGKKFAPVLFVLSLMSIASVMVIFIQNDFTGLINGTNPEEWTKTYTPTHTRCSPWLVGFGFGYFMHVNRNKKFHLSRTSQLLGWIACFAILLAIIFGPYFTISAHGHGTVLEAAFYEGWKRVSWAVALCWLTFACHFGFGGLINSFLSHPIWQPLGRLSFSLYLVHLTAIRMNFGIIRTQIYFTDYSMILQFWSSFGMAMVFAIVLTLAFESPILALEKFIFGREKLNKNTTLESNVSNNIINGSSNKTLSNMNQKD